MFILMKSFTGLSDHLCIVKIALFHVSKFLVKGKFESYI